MNFEYSPYILPLAAAAIVSSLVAVYAWVRRTTNGAFALFLMSLSITEWTIGYSLEIAGTNLETKYIWGVIQYFGIALAPYSLLMFSISYNDQIKMLSRRFIFLTALIPSITILLAFTTKWHGLIWSEYHIIHQENFSALGVSYGMWFWVHFAYSYIILLIGTILLVRTLFRKQGMYRGQIIAMLIAVLTPWISNILYFTGNSPIPYLDPTPFAFTITVAAVAWAIFGFHLVDITPLARDRVVDSMQDGMIVLDVRGNIVDINSAAARMIGVPVANAIGKTAGEIFSPWSHLIERFRNVMEAKDEISVGEGETKRSYEVRLSPLQDQQGEFVGRIIMLRAMDEGIPPPRFSTHSASSYSNTQPLADLNLGEDDLDDAHTLRGRFQIWNALIAYYSAPIKKDIPLPHNINPTWYRARERIFTIILRIAATVGTLGFLFSVPTSQWLVGGHPTFMVFFVLLWTLGSVRSFKYELRVTVFLLLIYGFGFIETLNFGFSVESFTFFMSLIISSAVLTSRRISFQILAISLLTMSVYAVLIGSKSFIPLTMTLDSQLDPPSVRAGISSVMVFFATTSAILASVIMLLENLSGAWQKETQALNLLQQERDLLEQRVEERTHELAEARDTAIKSSNELRKYYRAIDQSANSIVITDINGNIEYVNPKFEDVTGYSIEEVMGKNPRILKSGQQRAEFYEKMWSTISTGQVWTGIFHNKRKDGSLYWESATIAPVMDQNGVVTNYVAVKEDITVRRQSDEQLRKLSQAVEQSGNTIIIMDKDGIIEYVNPKFTEVTGYSLADALGKPTSVLMTRDETKRNYFEDEWWKTVATGNIWHGEFHNRRKDGGLFWESATIAPVHNQEGVITNYVEIKQDITEEKLLQEQLQKQNDYLSILHQVTLDLLNRRDINDLLQAVVDRSAILLDAPFSELLLEENGDLITQAFTNNLPNLKGDRVTRDKAKFTWQAFDTHQPVILEDYSMLQHQSTTYYPQVLHATADFPVMAGERCLGILALGRSQAGYTFTAEQIQTGILFARLAALVLDSANLYQSALQEISDRVHAEVQNEAFLRDIKALQEIYLELSEAENLSGLYVKMISLAQHRLGLDRVGLFIINENTGELQGTYGVDQDGQMRDESYYREPITEDHWSLEIINAYNHTKLWEDAPIFDDGREVGRGWKSAAALWNGQKAIGYLVSDNFVTHQSARPYEVEITSLLGSTFGHLIENKYNEVRLQESEARFRQIVENASDIIYRTDLEGHFTYANPAALGMMGFKSEDEVVGKSYLDLTTPEARHKLKRTYDHQFLSRTKNTYYEFPAVTVDGQIIWVGQNVQLIMDGDKIVGFQALARNITQLRQAQEAMLIARDQALDASRVKSQMLSRVSHELRTPLGGILGYAELLQGNAFGALSEKQAGAVGQIVESTHFLTKTVNDLLDEAQIEAKSLSLNNEYFSPTDFLNKVKTSMSVLAGKKNLAFHIEISPDLPNELYGDPHRLQQILVNLAGNAVKFTKAGEVRISLKRPTPAQWSMEVSDTGAGIHPNEFKTIFEPFHQVNNSITRENRGSGLGLAITKQLIELMGGQITVQSKVEKGSTFTVLLQIANAPGE